MANRYWVGGSGTWNTSTTNWSATSGGASGASAPTSADAVIIDSSSGSPTITLGSGLALTCQSITTTGATCSIVGSATSLTISGGMALSNATTWSSSTNITINATGTISTSGVTIGTNLFTFNAAGGTLTLLSNLTLGSTGVFTFTTGTLALLTFTISCFSFSSSVSSTRAIQFGTGNITATGGSGINIVGINLTYTGTPTVNLSDSSATSRSITLTGFSETNALNINVTTGSGSLSVTTASFFKSLNFTGFTGTWSPGTTNCTFYGSLTLVSGMTYTTGTGTFTFANTSGTATITSAGKTFSNIIQSGAGGTVALSGSLTLLNSTGTYSFTNGTLNLANNTLTTAIFSSNSVTTRVIQFGTGSININPLILANGFSMMGTNFTYTGTPTVNINVLSFSATDINVTSFTETNALNFNVVSGTQTVNILTGSHFKSLNFTGFTGTCSPSTATFYGSLTLVSGMTFTSTPNIFTFANTSGTATITSAGKTLNPITVSAPGGTVAFSGTTTLGSAALTITAGTLRLPASTTTTVGSFETTGTTLKYLTSSTPGTQATISDASGTDTVSYLSIQDSAATGGATWNAFVTSNNVDNGNNSGWIFTAPTVSNSNYFLLI